MRRFTCAVVSGSLISTLPSSSYKTLGTVKRAFGPRKNIRLGKLEGEKVDEALESPSLTNQVLKYFSCIIIFEDNTSQNPIDGLRKGIFFLINQSTMMF